MVNNVSNFNSTAYKNYAVQNSGITNPIAASNVKEQNNDSLLDTKTAQAIKSYNTPIINFKGDRTAVSLDDYKTKLTQAGKVEGKDFSVKELPYKDEIQMNILSADRKHFEKSIFWAGGTGKENYDGCVEFNYPKDGSDIIEVIKYYDKNGNSKMTTEHYKNGKNHPELFPQNINTTTTAKDYVKSLEASGANFDAENFEENGEKFTMVVEKDKEGNVIRMTSFTEASDGLKFINQENKPDEAGVLSKGIDICVDGERCDIMITKNN